MKTVVKQDSWASGGNMNTARNDLGGAGTQTAAVVFGGQTSPPTSVSNNSEEYDGSSWTEGNNLNTARSAMVLLLELKLQVYRVEDRPMDLAVLTVNVEEYGGTSWTEVNNLSHTWSKKRVVELKLQV